MRMTPAHLRKRQLIQRILFREMPLEALNGAVNARWNRGSRAPIAHGVQHPQRQRPAKGSKYNGHAGIDPRFPELLGLGPVRSTVWPPHSDGGASPSRRWRWYSA